MPASTAWLRCNAGEITRGKLFTRAFSLCLYSRLEGVGLRGVALRCFCSCSVLVITMLEVP